MHISYPLIFVAAKFSIRVAVLEKFGKHFLSVSPTFHIYAVFNFWWLDGTLYQPRLFQLAQMLRHSGFRNRKHLVYIAKETFVSLREEMQDCYTGGMPHRFCEPRKTLLFRRYL